MLSLRANKWLQSLGVKRTRWPHTRQQLERVFGENQALFELERRYGGLEGHELRIGVELVGGPLVVGSYRGEVWHLEANGAITGIADSLEKRLEQLALAVTVAGGKKRVRGAVGAELASRLGLVPLPEASDSRQLYWATPEFAPRQHDAILVRESQNQTIVGAGNHRREKQLELALSSLR